MPSEFKLSYTANDINNRLGKIDSLAEKSEIPTKTSQLNNDSGFLTKDDGFGTPDWNAKEGEQGHILNRTHYSEMVQAEILPETTLSFDEDGFSVLAESLDIHVGGNYIVSWNGTTYQCTAQEITIDGATAVAIGNTGAFNGIEPTTEPFIIMAFPEEVAVALGTSTMVLVIDGSTSATVSIGGEYEKVHKLPMKYIPDQVGIPTISLPLYGFTESINPYNEVLQRTLSGDTLDFMRSVMSSGCVNFYVFLSTDINLGTALSGRDIIADGGGLYFCTRIVRIGDEFFGYCPLPNGKQFIVELESDGTMFVALKSNTELVNAVIAALPKYEGEVVTE